MNNTFHTWKEPRTDKTEILFINGFLGAGKTTLLNAILRNAGDRKLAVLVNDVGEINIDADLVKDAVAETGMRLDGLVQLTNGCICCSSNAELPEAIFELIENYHPDQIVVESSGVAEPKNLYSSLSTLNSYHRSIMELLEITNMVTLTDPSYFLRKWKLSQESKKRTHLLHGDPRQPLIELMIDQVEYADLILMTKTDVIPEAEVNEAIGLIRSLNNRAKIKTTANGDIDPTELLDTKRFDHESTSNSAHWKQELLHSHHDCNDEGCSHEHHHHSDYGLETFLFTARKPFHHDRFLKLLRESFPGVIRAKGFYWTDRDSNFANFLSIAGDIVRADRSGQWYAELVEKGYKELEDMPETIVRVWDETVGDRRQEIVFIGIDMDQESMKAALEKCLVD